MQLKLSSGDQDRRGSAEAASIAGSAEAASPGPLLTEAGGKCPPEKNFTVKEAAALLSISAQSVYKMCSQKKVRHLRLGIGRGTVRIPASALDDFIAQATVQPDEPAAPEPGKAKESTTSRKAGASQQFQHVRWSRLPDSPPDAVGRS